jgi:hypothetical protein
LRNALPAHERRTDGILRARMYRRLALLACACVALMGLAPAAAQAAQPPKRFYVSLGDSYASGWQPTGVGQGATRATALRTRCRALRLAAAIGSCS